MQQDGSPATVKVDFYEANTPRSDLEAYRGLLVHALPGLHQFVMETLLKTLPRSSLSGLRVVDLGCGQGALSLRLADAGATVCSCDYVTSNYRASGSTITFSQVDLNTHFAKALGGEQHDIAMAIEIIEHLENPRNFVRECRKLLQPGGMLILSTPNIDSSRSKVDFLLEGCFHMFRESSYRSSGHITPISGWQLSKIVQEASFETALHTTFGTEDHVFRQRPKAYILQELFRRWGKRNSWGDGALHVVALRAR